MSKILIVEDDQKLAKVVAMHLRDEGHQIEVAYSLEVACEHLEDFKPTIVITDLMIGDDSGLEILALAKREAQLPDVIFVTGHASTETAAQAMSDGAYEYLSKPFSLEEISHLVKRISERRALVDQQPGKRKRKSSKLIAASDSMKQILNDLDQVVQLNTTVLIRGESGTGKEEIARFIHREGDLNQPFVAINCGAIPENLLSSELFGHEKGSFTGASAQRAGAFERADGGILFLDELGDISLSTQVHLLRALETKEATRVGGERPFQFDVRLLAATNKNLEDMIEDGSFREDLYYRLNVYPVELAPLRDRKEDIFPLAYHFLQDFGLPKERTAQASLEPLLDYPWPGNIRELRNVAENIFIRSLKQEITSDLVKQLLPKSRAPQNGTTSTPTTLEEAESQQILEALDSSKGNKTEAAKLLGITRRRLYSRMKILGLDD